MTTHAKAAKKPFISNLVLCHLIILFLVSTFLFPPTRAVWDFIDEKTFRLINSSLAWGSWWQTFWAFSSKRMADWIEDFVILGFYIAYCKTSKKPLKTAAAECLLCALLIASVILFVNNCLLRHYLIIYRKSPTLVLDDTYRLSQLVPWLKPKDGSSRSFPSDHATTALLFAFTYGLLAKGRLRVAAWIYSIYLCMPRMIAGAHWLTDVVVGSGSLVLFTSSWVFFTSFKEKAILTIEKFFTLTYKAYRNAVKYVV